MCASGTRCMASSLLNRVKSSRVIALLLSFFCLKKAFTRSIKASPGASTVR